MDISAITEYLTGHQNFDDAQLYADPNPPDSFYFFHGSDRMMPFATIVTSDRHDPASNLSREGVFRLNIGVGREAYHAMLGPPPKPPKWPPEGTGVVDAPYDFTAVDQIMPHPVCAPQYWICALNPSDATFEKLRPPLTGAYQIAVRRHRK
jgi:Family of unknown function (DUF6194)